ncbi:lonely Cys domain-containing protein [Streptomyces sp. NPDC001177]
MVTALDGTQFRDSDIHSSTIVTSNPALTGRTFIPDKDSGRAREEAYWMLPTFTEILHYDPTGQRLVAVEKLPSRFWSAVRKYYSLHGLPGRGDMSLKEDLETKRIGGQEFGRHLTRRASFSDLRTGDKIYLEACWGGAPADRPWDKRVDPDEDPWVIDAWEAVSFGQHVANETRHNVLSPTRKSFVRPSAAGPYERGSVTSRRLRPGYLAEFVPEPMQSELDALARVAGLHAGPDPVSEQVRHLVLRLVRGLRLTFGTSVEDDRGDPNGFYQRLLRGIGALELMRARDPHLGPATPLCSSLLERVARAAAGQSGVTGPAPDAAAYRTLLERALQAVHGQPGIALTQFVALPRLVATARQVVTLAPTDAMVRQMLGLNASAPMRSGERIRLFWAVAKTDEFLDRTPAQPSLVRKVLHLLPSTVVNPTHLGVFRRLVLQAVVLGYDVDNLNVLAALDLVRRGALAPRTRLLNTQGKTQGRNWTRQRIPTVGTDLRVLFSSLVGGPPAEAYERGPWTVVSDGQPYLLNAHGATGHVLFEWEDGSQTWAPYDEVAELVAIDPELVDNPDMAGDRDIPPTLIPVIPGFSDAGVESLGKGTGLTTWHHDNIQLTAPGSSGLHVLTVTSRPGPARHGFRFYVLPTGPVGSSPQQLPMGPQPPTPPLALFSAAPVAGASSLTAVAGEDLQQTGEDPLFPPSQAPKTRPGVVDFAGAALVLEGVDGRGDRLVEALVRSVRGAVAPEVLASGSEELAAVLAGTSPMAEAADAVYRWAAGHVTEESLPGEPLLGPAETATIEELDGVGVTLTEQQRVQAVLHGDVLEAADVGLSRAQQFRLLVGRSGGDRSGVVGQVVAAVVADVLGVYVTVADAGDPGGDVICFGPVTGVPVLVVRDGGRHLAAVPPAVPPASGSPVSEGVVSGRGGVRGVSPRAPLGARGDGGWPGGQAELAAVRSLAGEVMDLIEAFGQGAASGGVVSDFEMFVLLVQECVWRHGARGDLLVLFPELAERLDRVLDAGQYAQVVAVLTQPAGQVDALGEGELADVEEDDPFPGADLGAVGEFPGEELDFDFGFENEFPFGDVDMPGVEAGEQQGAASSTGRAGWMVELLGDEMDFEVGGSFALTSADQPGLGAEGDALRDGSAAGADPMDLDPDPNLDRVPGLDLDPNLDPNLGLVPGRVSDVDADFEVDVDVTEDESDAGGAVGGRGVSVSGQPAKWEVRRAALVEVFGDDVEADQGRFRELMRRVAVLDAARSRDPKLSEGPLSREALEELAGRVLGPGLRGREAVQRLIDVVGELPCFALPAPWAYVAQNDRGVPVGVFDGLVADLRGALDAYQAPGEGAGQGLSDFRAFRDRVASIVARYPSRADLRARAFAALDKRLTRVLSEDQREQIADIFAYDMPDSLWNTLEPHLRRHGKTARLGLGGIAFAILSGMGWTTLPRRYGTANAVSLRCYRLMEDNRFGKMLTSAGGLRGVSACDLGWLQAASDESAARLGPEGAAQVAGGALPGGRDTVAGRTAAPLSDAVVTLLEPHLAPGSMARARQHLRAFAFAYASAPQVVKLPRAEAEVFRRWAVGGCFERMLETARAHPDVADDDLAWLEAAAAAAQRVAVGARLKVLFALFGAGVVDEPRFPALMRRLKAWDAWRTNEGWSLKELAQRVLELDEGGPVGVDDLRRLFEPVQEGHPLFDLVSQLPGAARVVEAAVGQGPLDEVLANVRDQIDAYKARGQNAAERTPHFQDFYDSVESEAIKLPLSVDLLDLFPDLAPEFREVLDDAQYGEFVTRFTTSGSDPTTAAGSVRPADAGAGTAGEGPQAPAAQRDPNSPQERLRKERVSVLCKVWGYGIAEDAGRFPELMRRLAVLDQARISDPDLSGLSLEALARQLMAPHETGQASASVPALTDEAWNVLKSCWPTGGSREGGRRQVLAVLAERYSHPERKWPPLPGSLTQSQVTKQLSDWGGRGHFSRMLAAARPPDSAAHSALGWLEAIEKDRHDVGTRRRGWSGGLEQGSGGGGPGRASALTDDVWDVLKSCWPSGGSREGERREVLAVLAARYSHPERAWPQQLPGSLTRKQVTDRLSDWWNGGLFSRILVAARAPGSAAASALGWLEAIEADRRAVQTRREGGSRGREGHASASVPDLADDVWDVLKSCWPTRGSRDAKRREVLAVLAARYSHPERKWPPLGSRKRKQVTDRLSDWWMGGNFSAMLEKARAPGSAAASALGWLEAIEADRLAFERWRGGVSGGRQGRGQGSAGGGSGSVGVSAPGLAQVALSVGVPASREARAALLREAFGPGVVHGSDFGELMRRVAVLDAARLRDAVLSQRPLSLEVLARRVLGLQASEEVGAGELRGLLDRAGAPDFVLPVVGGDVVSAAGPVPVEPVGVVEPVVPVVVGGGGFAAGGGGRGELSGGRSVVPVGAPDWVGGTMPDGFWRARAAAVPVRVEHRWADPVSKERFVVAGAFLTRRFWWEGRLYLDVTVRVGLEGYAEGDRSAVVERLWGAAQGFYNDDGRGQAYVFPDGAVAGDRLHVSLEVAGAGEEADWRPSWGEGDRLTQHTLPASARVVDWAHELGHQLGLPDEAWDLSARHRPDVMGSLMGEYGRPFVDTTGELAGLTASERVWYRPGGLRRRYLSRLARIIGDIDVSGDVQPSEPTARGGVQGRGLKAPGLDPIAEETEPGEEPLPAPAPETALEDLPQLSSQDRAEATTSEPATSHPDQNPQPQQNTDPTPDPRPTPLPEAPWYMDHDALGEARVTSVVDPWTPEQAEPWADQIADGVRRTGDSSKLDQGIRNELRDLLATSGHETWNSLLRRGRQVVVDGKLVWIQPVPRDVQHRPEKSESAVREYAVGFASTKISSKARREISKELDSALLGLFKLGSLVLSRLVPGFPAVGVGVSGAWDRKQDWSLLSSRKLFIADNTPFRAGMAVRVFVDGEEWPNDVVLPQRLGLTIPAPLSAPNGPRPDDTVPLEGGYRPGGAVSRPTRAREVLNAVDLIPVTAALQQQLRASGLPADAVKSLVDQIQDVLNEQSVINRSRALFTNGIVSGKMRASVGPMRWFQGHVAIRADIDSLQYLADTPGIAVRDDMGVGVSSASARGAKSKASLNSGFNLLGLQSGTSDGVTGLLPALKVSIKSQSATSHGLTEQTLGHTVLNHKGDRSRYRSGLRITVDIRSTTHSIPTVSRVVQADVGVPRQEAADFERRLLGSVRTPALRAEELAGPVAAQPHVRTLLRIADASLPASAYRRPRSLDIPLPPPHPREPLALAMRRGQGFGMGVLLPGAELVHDQLRWALARRHRAAQGGAQADWSATDLALNTWFSRPSLEADIPRLLAGIDHTVRLGGRDYQLAVKGHLRRRVGGETYPMTVNARALRSALVKGHQKKSYTGKVAGGAGLRLKIRSMLMVQLGAFGAGAEYETGSGDTFTGGAKSYRRTETAGQVDEHVYEIVYEMTLRPKAKDGGPAETWWIDRPKDVVARIVVPEEHIPATPTTQAMPAAGKATELKTWPAGPHVDFADGGTSGLYPAFFVMPELSRLAAEAYAKANGLPESWTQDALNWPTELKNMTAPSAQASNFAELTSHRGHVVELPEGSDGHRQALRMRLRGYQAQRLNAIPRLELEQYAQGLSQHEHSDDHKWEAGPQASLGPQFRFGADAGEGGGEHTVPDGKEAHGPQGAHHRPRISGGRLQMTLQGAAAWGREHEEGVEQGAIDISRATYTGTAHHYRMDPVYEVTLIRWKGEKLTEYSRYLRVTQALEVLAPERRLPDLKLTAPGVETPAPTPPLRHAHPMLLPGTGYPEKLDADGVLERIIGLLQTRGVLRKEAEGAGQRPNLLMRELIGSFASEPLRNQWPALKSDGVMRWIPIPRAFGATQYLCVRVTADIAPADGHLPRPDVKLTLRSEGLDETRKKDVESFSRDGGLDVRGRGGDGTGHGGAQLAVGYSRSSTEADEQLHKVLDILRANPREGSEEFRYPLTFRIEMGLSTQPPEAPDVLVRGARGLFLGTGRLLGHGKTAADWWYRHRPLVWHHVEGPTTGTADEGTGHRAADSADGAPVSGSIRLLLPSHLTTDGPQTIDIRPVHGTGAAWQAAAPMPRPASEQTAMDRLIENLHPWAVPAAAAVGRWAALPAAPFHPPADLGAPDAWHVPGLDFTTLPGLRYTHHTGQGMLKPRTAKLLRNTYEIAVGDDSVTVGLEITGARPLPGVREMEFKARHYVQDSEADEHQSGRERGFYLAFGPEVGGEPNHDTSVLAEVPGEWEREVAQEQSGELGEVDEQNQEGIRRYRHYVFDVDVVLTGKHGTIRVHAPGGLYGMLPLERHPESGAHVPADGLEQSLPGVFGSGTPALAGSGTSMPEPTSFDDASPLPVGAVPGNGTVGEAESVVASGGGPETAPVVVDPREPSAGGPNEHGGTADDSRRQAVPAVTEVFGQGAASGGIIGDVDVSGDVQPSDSTVRGGTQGRAWRAPGLDLLAEETKPGEEPLPAPTAETALEDLAQRSAQDRAEALAYASPLPTPPGHGSDGEVASGRGGSGWGSVQAWAASVSQSALPAVLRWVGPGAVDFGGVALVLEEVDGRGGRGDHLVEALVRSVRAVVAPEVFASGSELGAVLAGSGGVAEVADAVYRWAGEHVTEESLPGEGPLLGPAETVTIAELAAVGVTLAEPQRVQAMLQGGVLRVAEVGLSRGQQFRLVVGRPGGDRSGAVGRAVAAMVAEALGVCVTVADAGDAGGVVTSFGPGAGAPVLVVREGGRHLAAVPPAAPAALSASGSPVSEGVVSGRGGVRGVSPRAPLGARGDGGWPGGQEELAAVRSLAGEVMDLVEAFGQGAASGGVVSDFEMFVLLVQECVWRHGARGDLLVLFPELAERLDRVLDAGQYAQVVTVLTQPAGQVDGADLGAVGEFPGEELDFGFGFENESPFGDVDMPGVEAGEPHGTTSPTGQPDWMGLLGDEMDFEVGGSFAYPSAGQRGLGAEGDDDDALGDGAGGDEDAMDLDPDPNPDPNLGLVPGRVSDVDADFEVDVDVAVGESDAGGGVQGAVGGRGVSVSGQPAQWEVRRAALVEVFGDDVEADQGRFGELMRRVAVLDAARSPDPELSEGPLSREALEKLADRVLGPGLRGREAVQRLIDVVGELPCFALPEPWVHVAQNDGGVPVGMLDNLVADLQGALDASQAPGEGAGQGLADFRAFHDRVASIVARYPSRADLRARAFAALDKRLARVLSEDQREQIADIFAYDMPDTLWNTLKPHLVRFDEITPLVFGGIAFDILSGMKWSALPRRYGNFVAVQKRYYRLMGANLYGKMLTSAGGLRGVSACDLGWLQAASDESAARLRRRGAAQASAGALPSRQDAAAGRTAAPLSDAVVTLLEPHLPPRSTARARQHLRAFALAYGSAPRVVKLSRAQADMFGRWAVGGCFERMLEAARKHPDVAGDDLAWLEAAAADAQRVAVRARLKVLFAVFGAGVVDEPRFPALMRRLKAWDARRINEGWSLEELTRWALGLDEGGPVGVDDLRRLFEPVQWGHALFDIVSALPGADSDSLVLVPAAARVVEGALGQGLIDDVLASVRDEIDAYKAGGQNAAERAPRFQKFYDSVESEAIKLPLSVDLLDLFPDLAPEFREVLDDAQYGEFVTRFTTTTAAGSARPADAGADAAGEGLQAPAAQRDPNAPQEGLRKERVSVLCKVWGYGIVEDAGRFPELMRRLAVLDQARMSDQGSGLSLEGLAHQFMAPHVPGQASATTPALPDEVWDALKFCWPKGGSGEGERREILAVLAERYSHPEQARPLLPGSLTQKRVTDALSEWWRGGHFSRMLAAARAPRSRAASALAWLEAIEKDRRAVVPQHRGRMRQGQETASASVPALPDDVWDVLKSCWPKPEKQGGERRKILAVLAERYSRPGRDWPPLGSLKRRHVTNALVKWWMGGNFSAMLVAARAPGSAAASALGWLEAIEADRRAVEARREDGSGGRQGQASASLPDLADDVWDVLKSCWEQGGSRGDGRREVLAVLAARYSHPQRAWPQQLPGSLTRKQVTERLSQWWIRGNFSRMLVAARAPGSAAASALGWLEAIEADRRAVEARREGGSGGRQGQGEGSAGGGSGSAGGGSGVDHARQ